MNKIRIALLTLAALAIGYAASAETVTPGTDGTSGDYGPAYLDAATSKLWCSQAPGISVQLPNQSSPVSWPACSTAQIMSSDICTNTAGGCPILDTNSRLPVAQMPPITVVTPTGMACAGKTDTTTSTSTATGTAGTTFYQTAAQPVTCTVLSTSTVVVLPNATKTWTGTLTVTQTDIGTTAQTAGTIPIRDGTGHIPAVDVPHASGDVVANTAITASGATNKIVQYDAKGLVVSGVDATAANIGAVAGSGLGAGYLTKATGASTVASSSIYDDGAGHVGIGATSGSALTSLGDATFTGTVYANGVALCQSDGNNCPAGGRGTGMVCSGTCTTGSMAKFSAGPALTNATAGTDYTTPANVTTAINTAVNGTTNYGTQFTGAHVVGNAPVQYSGSDTFMTGTAHANGGWALCQSNGVNCPLSGIWSDYRYGPYSVVAATGATWMTVATYTFTAPATGHPSNVNLNGVVSALSGGPGGVCHTGFFIDGTTAPYLQCDGTTTVIQGGTVTIPTVCQVAVTSGSSHNIYLQISTDSGSFSCSVAANQAHLTAIGTP